MLVGTNWQSEGLDDVLEKNIKQVGSIAGTRVRISGNYGSMTVMGTGNVNEGPITLKYDIPEHLRIRFPGLHDTTTTIENAYALGQAIGNFETGLFGGKIVEVKTPYRR